MPSSLLPHQVGLAGDWALWRDFAVRSTGFGVAGLEAFGSADEEERLAEVAGDPRFREAVAWQSRGALRGGVDKLLAGGEPPSRRRRRAEVVAAYAQRYCAKNDTIGFFGPLGWGRFGDASAVRAGAPQAERVVHLETWAVEALARALGDHDLLPMHPFPERALRARLAGDGLTALDRLEAARAAVAAAAPAEVPAALDALEHVFEQLTGRPAMRGEGDSGGGRTVAYLDCMRDLDLTLGPEILDELQTTLPAVLEASRWWCGRVFARGTEALARVAGGRNGPVGPLLGELMGAAWGLHAQMGDEQRELQRRWASVAGGDLADLRERAEAAFADHQPAWRWSAYHSCDVQIAAADAEAMRRGRFSIVLGDLHGGGNPLVQGLFAHRHPAPGAIAARTGAELGPRVELLPPRRGPVDMTARMFPVYRDGDVLVLSGEEPAPPGTRAVQIGDVELEDGEVADRAGTFRIPLAELLFLPIFISAVRTFELTATTGRQTLGRTVIRRARWSAPAAEIAAAGDHSAWARGRGLPRRVFARSPLERKPMLVDFESPALCRVLRRWATRTAQRAPGARMELSEMLPGPDDCWLEDETGRHTSELRLVAVDTSRRGR